MLDDFLCFVDSNIHYGIGDIARNYIIIEMEKGPDKRETPKAKITVLNKHFIIIVILGFCIVTILGVLYYNSHRVVPLKKSSPNVSVYNGIKKDTGGYWIAPDIDTIRNAELKEQVQYGKDLITHTSKYFGPKGSVLQISNGLNCQNCHLQAGTAVFANNYGSVASLYPKFRARSGSVEDIYQRVNDCFERSLNGKAIDTVSKEMLAIVSYLNFIGSNVERGKKAAGSGLKAIKFLDRAADPEKGKSVYTNKCQSCHQSNGKGRLNPDGNEYVFPALWGKHSFNDGAGLYRTITIAKYVKYNMPQGTTYKNPVLTDEEAWDVAAFISSQARPHVNETKDWPDISKKPVDDPFGPYADNFSEKQHKYGPFGQMKGIANEVKK